MTFINIQSTNIYKSLIWYVTMSTPNDQTSLASVQIPLSSPSGAAYRVVTVPTSLLTLWPAPPPPPPPPALSKSMTRPKSASLTLSGAAGGTGADQQPAHFALPRHGRGAPLQQQPPPATPHTPVCTAASRWAVSVTGAATTQWGDLTAASEDIDVISETLLEIQKLRLTSTYTLLFIDWWYEIW